MKHHIDFEKVPHNYAMCLNSTCSQSSTCLRYLAAESAPDYLTEWTIISPKYLSNKVEGCPQYRSSRKIRYAKGFITLLNNIPLKQSKAVQQKLMSLLGQRTYYRCRKGERLLSPDEQSKIEQLLRQCHVATPLTFDAYVEDYNW